MNINDLTKLLGLLSGLEKNSVNNTQSLNDQIGEKVIVRTFSAGVWFGELQQKSKDEVILVNARRVWRFWCARSISLSGVAQYGLNQEKSKICPAVSKVFLNAIEIISMTDKAIESLEDAKDAEAE